MRRALPSSTSDGGPLVIEKIEDTGEELDAAELLTLWTSSTRKGEAGPRHGSGTCMRCGRDAFSQAFEPKLQLRFPARTVRHAVRMQLGPDTWPDVAATWECFGPGSRENDPRSPRVALPMLIVSQRVCKIWRTLVPMLRTPRR